MPKAHPKIKPNRRTVAPVAVSRKVSTNPPKLNGKNNFTVSHTELIQTSMIAKADFVAGLRSFLIQPGVDLTFPWLSSIASRYEYYHFNSLCFTYIPRCPTTTAGTISMALELDVADPAPSSDIRMLSYSHAVRGSPWCELVYRVPADQLKRKSQDLYTRTVAVSTGFDARLYDFGRLYLSLSGVDDTIFGDLSVSYSVTFSVPQLSDSTEALTVYHPVVGSAPPATIKDHITPLLADPTAVISALTSSNVPNIASIVTVIAGILQFKAASFPKTVFSSMNPSKPGLLSDTVIDVPGLRFLHEWRGRCHIQGYARFRNDSGSAKPFYLHYNNLDTETAGANPWPHAFPMVVSPCVTNVTHTESSLTIGSLTKGSTVINGITYQTLATSNIANDSYFDCIVDVMLDIVAKEGDVLEVHYNLSDILADDGDGLNTEWTCQTVGVGQVLNYGSYNFMPLGEGAPELQAETGPFL